MFEYNEDLNENDADEEAAEMKASFEEKVEIIGDHSESYLEPIQPFSLDD
jgi:hypothetical protein